MKREIKFRAKNDSNEWVFGNLIMDNCDLEYGIITHNYYGDETLRDIIIPVKKETICQFVRKNEKGIDIYENDVVKTPFQCMNSSHRICVVSWENHCSEFLLFEKNGMTHHIFPECELLGNIFDNVEFVDFQTIA